MVLQGTKQPAGGFLQPFERFSKIYVEKVVFALGLVACNSTDKSNKFTKMFGTNKKFEKRYFS